VRAFATAGFFTQGAWFVGGGAGFQATRRVSVAAAITRAWTTSASGVAMDRREVSGSVAYAPRPTFAVFGSVGQTVATLDQDGAGTTIGAGVMLLLSPALFK
jgi:hypothetical protein